MIINLSKVDLFYQYNFEESNDRIINKIANLKNMYVYYIWHYDSDLAL